LLDDTEVDLGRVCDITPHFKTPCPQGVGRHFSGSKTPPRLHHLLIGPTNG